MQDNGLQFVEIFMKSQYVQNLDSLDCISPELGGVQDLQQQKAWHMWFEPQLLLNSAMAKAKFSLNGI